MSSALTIEACLDKYRNGQHTPESMVRECLARIRAEKDNPIWIYTLSEQELQPYIDALKGKSVDDLPLYGIPFAIKDNIDLANVPTTAACPDFSYTPSEHAFVVQQLIEAGAIPLGKTNLDQFATGLVGTRSPYGVVKNAINPRYISGGSSSGSGVAVALGQVAFALGTDTAGSGRVPAAFNDIIGWKPTKGLLSTRGVVPACRSLDCVTVFSPCLEDVRRVKSIISVFDDADSFARSPTQRYGGPTLGTRIGVPQANQLAFFGNKAYEKYFSEYLSALKLAGYEVLEIDFSPFIEAAQLLYDGPWVAERYIGVQDLMQSSPESVLEVTRSIIANASMHSAADTFTAMYQLAELKRIADNQLTSVDVVLTPTAGTIFTPQEIAEEPVLRNTQLGYYTNFMNLLDYAALAVPFNQAAKDMPFGVTLFTPAWGDDYLLNLADAISKLLANEPVAESLVPGYIPVAVCGAHLSGMPLNWQLTDRKAYRLQVTTTAPCYQFYALAGGPPYRPGLVRMEKGGAAIDVEVWAVPESSYGSFVAGIPEPLGIGKTQLADGTSVPGFICEPIGIQGAEDITELKNWRAYIARR